MRTLYSVPDPAARFEARDPASRQEALRPAPRSNRSSAGRGLDGWTVLLIGAIVAGLVGMLIGGALSV